MAASKPSAIPQEESLTCHECKSHFTRRANLLQHLRRVHKLQTPGKSHGCAKCSECFSTPIELLRHATDVHQFKQETICLSFKSEKDFTTWKQDEEDKCHAKYVCSTSAKSLAGNSKRQYVECHRSGKMKTATGHGQRTMKSQGFCKIGNKCFSSMIVTTQGQVKDVVYQKQHYGHDMDVGHLTLTDKERAEIAGKLSQGVPIKVIMKDIRTSISGPLRPLHLLERPQVHNIKRQFNITYNERCHQDDHTSVGIWAQAMMSQDNSLVKLFKQPGMADPTGRLSERDFALVLMTEPQQELLQKLGTDKICIDSTHGGRCSKEAVRRVRKLMSDAEQILTESEEALDLRLILIPFRVQRLTPSDQRLAVPEDYIFLSAEPDC
ncbi:hypothetical protein HPB47_017749 [Ixodes persulcatus]|uniref:Uncharacterized protein n=1 Tax=Ixodes persulcatus TaxID=34615 RepID=A0AC60QMJ7_IXOPE|nr:hypothetical protein HPB47_017749 [Ixodes persulcatus]